MKVSNALIYLLAVLGMESAEAARSYGHIVAPRNYDHSRRSNAFDLVTEVMTTPMILQDFANTMMRQHNAAVSRLASSAPRYDVTFDEEAGIIELYLEVPGVSSKDITIELEDNKSLRIHGSKKTRVNGNTVDTKFDQVFELHGEADPESLRASLNKGILTIQATKRERLTRRIDIQDEAHEDSIRKTPASDGATDQDIEIKED